MPRVTSQEVGTIHRVRVEKTFLDYVKQGLQIVGLIALVVVIVAIAAA